MESSSCAGDAGSPPVAFTETTRSSAGLGGAGIRRTRTITAKTQTAIADAAIDRVLITRFNGGDEAAFVEIVSRHRERIQSLAGGFVRNHADAEEITQDTFVRAHRGLARFRGEASLATWLHRVVANLARNRYWYFFRRRRHMTLSLDCPLGPDAPATFTDLIAGTDADPAQEAAANEFAVAINACMDRLESADREILTLRTLLHASYQDIGRKLCINEGTVKSRIARARGRLRALMTEVCPELGADVPTSDWFEPARGAARLH